ncbi:MAG TPA: hypothetical protein VMN78_04315 [Longimicrobiales bacterium]|nr:hypothetical protein [Longimicrobiales bacterium]
MTRRTRFFAGISLIAMTAALAEGVVASACVPGMDMAPDAMATPDVAPASDESMDDMAEPGQRNDIPNDGGDCPFAPMASAQGCLAIASIPANTVTVAAPLVQAASRILFDDKQYDLLLETTLFHPPRS